MLNLADDVALGRMGVPEARRTAAPLVHAMRAQESAVPLARGLRFATGGELTVPGDTVDPDAEVAVEPTDATD